MSTPEPTTPVDRRIDKHQLRRQKNRAAAHQFRERQKEYISSLEKSTFALTTDNAALRAKLDVLQSESKVLHEQLIYLRSLIGQAVQGSQVVNADAPPTKT